MMLGAMRVTAMPMKPNIVVAGIIWRFDDRDYGRTIQCSALGKVVGSQGSKTPHLNWSSYSPCRSSQHPNTDTWYHAETATEKRENERR